MPLSSGYIDQIERNDVYYDVHDTDLRSKIGEPSGIAQLDSSGLVPASQLPSYVDDVKNGYYANSQFYPESSPTYPGYFYNNEFYKDIDHTIVITPVTDSYYYDISGDTYYTYDGSAYAETTAPTAMTPENDKIYVNLAADPAEIYRWSGIAYVKMSSGDGGLVLGETSETAYRGDRGKTAYDHSQDSGRITSAVASGLYKVAATAQGHVASLAAVQKSDITALGIPESDTNTTYTFAGGTNKFTVTPSGGTAQDITITPSIANNVTGSGTNGYLTKFNGANTITNGPAIGTDTTKYLRNDGTWQVPPDNNTTYTFAGGTNKFTVTPSGGTAQDVTVTPSIANNVTGSGTSGYIAKFNGENTITNGPAIGTDTTKFLRNDGTWQVPPNDTTNTIPSAYCDTAAGTAAKAASCTNYNLLDKSYLHVLIVNANTSASAI